MTPQLNARQLRDAIRKGGVRADQKMIRRPPPPPPEWQEWRRKRMQASILAASWFLQGKDWVKIRSLLWDRRLTESSQTSRQRISQYVRRGVLFLADRGCFSTGPK